MMGTMKRWSPLTLLIAILFLTIALANLGATLHQDGTGSDEFWRALIRSDAARVQRILRECPGLANLPVSRGEAVPLGYAPNQRIAEILIACGADLNRTNQAGITPLHTSIFLNNIPVAKLLIDRGASIEGASKSGATPLMAAALCGREEIARYLIEKGANVNARNKTGLTPLHFAADQSYPEPSIVRMLLERGADVEARDSVGLTPLARAERNGNRLLVDSLRRTIALRVRKDGAGLRQKALSRSAAGEDYAG